MPDRIPQRDSFDHTPERLSEYFRLVKARDKGVLTTVCEVWSHPFGWELRMSIEGHGLVMSQVVRSPGELYQIAEAWKTGAIEKGWSS